VYGVDCGLLVPVIGRGDEDGVDIFSSENLAVVAGDEEIGAPELFCVGEAAVVTVCYCDEFDTWDLEGCAGVALTLNACTDEGQLDVVIGRVGRCRCCLRQKRVQAGCSCGDGCRLSSGLEEGPAINHGMTLPFGVVVERVQ
jgi:hypothetical protein